MKSTQLVKNLRYLMEKRMETANAVAVSSGIKASTLMRLLDGSSAAPRNSTLQALAIHFGVGPEMLLKADLSVEVAELVEHKSVSEPISLLEEHEVFQLYHWNEADTTEGSIFYRRLSNDRTWLPPPPDQELIDLIKESSEDVLPPIFAFKVKGQAMAPTINDGDIVFVRYTPTNGIFDEDGELVGFTTPNEIKSGHLVLAYCGKKDRNDKTHARMVVRQYCPDDTSDNEYLLSTNPDWPGERSLLCERIIGKIVGRYTKF